MQFTSISFEKLFPTGAYANEKIRAEMSLNPGEDAMGALQEARKLVNENFEKNNPHLVTPDIPIIPKQPEEKSMTPYEVAKSLDMPLDAQIATCDDIEILKSYKFIVKGKPELEKIYSEKLKELSK